MAPDLIHFAATPLDRASVEHLDPGAIDRALGGPEALLLPLLNGDPLVEAGRLVFMKASRRTQYPAAAATVFLGRRDGQAYFAIDATGAEVPNPSGVGQFTPMREAAGALSHDDLAIAGQARWYLDWRRTHRFCVACGAATELRDGGLKQVCAGCGAESFPRINPVAIVLAVHDGACLLGRGPHFPPGFLSALAGFVEAAETPEAAAVRELREEAGVALTDVRYCFSQPWPFPASMMMGFIADAESRDLTLDTKEIEEARWVSHDEIVRLLNGERRDDLRLPPRFTIARRLVERWAGQ